MLFAFYFILYSIQIRNFQFNISYLYLHLASSSKSSWVEWAYHKVNLQQLKKARTVPGTLHQAAITKIYISTITTTSTATTSISTTTTTSPTSHHQTQWWSTWFGITWAVSVTEVWMLSVWLLYTGALASAPAPAPAPTTTSICRQHFTTQLSPANLAGLVQSYATRSDQNCTRLYRRLSKKVIQCLPTSHS